MTEKQNSNGNSVGILVIQNVNGLKYFILIGWMGGHEEITEK